MWRKAHGRFSTDPIPDHYGRTRRVFLIHCSRAQPRAVKPWASLGSPTPLSPVGKLNWKTAPWGTLAVAHSRPRWASMIVRLIVRPIPIPLDFVVKKSLCSSHAFRLITRIGHSPHVMDCPQ